MKISKILFGLLFFAVLASCDSTDPYDPYRTVPSPFDIAGKQKVTLPNGLAYYIVSEGVEEDSVTLRSTVDVFYTGRFTSNRVFETTYMYGSLSPQQVYLPSFIMGFAYGAVGMRVGEKRKVIIPPHLAYGQTPGHQLEKDTLVFDIELDFIYPQKIVPED